MPGFLFYDHTKDQTSDDYEWGRDSRKRKQAKCDYCCSKVEHSIFQRLKQNYG